jgi:hypothetical protein
MGSARARCKQSRVTYQETLGNEELKELQIAIELAPMLAAVQQHKCAQLSDGLKAKKKLRNF